MDNCIVEFLANYPLLKCYWPNSKETNRQLEAFVLQEEQRSKGVTYSNAGGWHSEHVIQDWAIEGAVVLVARVKWAAQELMTQLGYNQDINVLKMWANINRKGHKNYPHVHQAFMSGVYYVNGNHNSGFTKFVKGRQQMPPGHPSGVPVHLVKPYRGDLIEECTIQPQEGLMAVFPGTLLHYVEPYEDEGHRITIAFNINPRT